MDWRTRWRAWARKWLPSLAGVPIALLYGLFTRWVFGLPSQSEVLNTMTCGFLFVVPIVMGSLTVRLAPPEARRSNNYVTFAPMISIIAATAIATLWQWEAVICIVMALPLFLLLASFGGRLFKTRGPVGEEQKFQMLSLALLILLPYLITPLEMQLPQPDSLRLVENSIEIEADVATVWAQIASVPEIQPAEQGWNFFHLVGLPKPLAATLSHEGVGGVRNATFEGGLTFVETVTVWEEGERLSFSIARNKGDHLAMPLNQIGGQYFDVLDGTYRIEPLGEGRLRLHLSSEHRISTRFNFYGGAWTELIMWDLQRYILEIIKARAERQALGLALIP